MEDQKDPDGWVQPPKVVRWVCQRKYIESKLYMSKMNTDVDTNEL